VQLRQNGEPRQALNQALVDHGLPAMSSNVQAGPRPKPVGNDVPMREPSTVIKRAKRETTTA